jgi:uncharacterized membrane protein
MKVENVMLVISALMFLGSIAWAVRDVRRETRATREQLEALVKEARRIARGEEGEG